MKRVQKLFASLRFGKVAYVAFFTAFFMSVLTSQQAMAGFAPILVGYTVIVVDRDRQG